MTCNVLMGTLNPTHPLTHFDIHTINHSFTYLFWSGALSDTTEKDQAQTNWVNVWCLNDRATTTPWTKFRWINTAVYGTGI